MAEPKQTALRETQLRLKALVCETVALRESLQRESQRKGVALDAAKRQEQLAKGANRKLKESEYFVRCCLRIFTRSPCF
jgi:CRISPR/Cas system CSM-associated protein Csm2 small subunit